VVICRDYARKEWCGLEWDAIFDLLKQRRENQVVLSRFDYAIVDGLFSDVRQRFRNLTSILCWIASMNSLVKRSLDLYPTLALKASSEEVLRILLSYWRRRD
jgi:hypothetical protein